MQVIQQNELFDAMKKLAFDLSGAFHANLKQEITVRFYYLSPPCTFEDYVEESKTERAYIEYIDNESNQRFVFEMKQTALRQFSHYLLGGSVASVPSAEKKQWTLLDEKSLEFMAERVLKYAVEDLFNKQLMVNRTGNNLRYMPFAPLHESLFVFNFTAQVNEQTVPLRLITTEPTLTQVFAKEETK